jgi:hypothetical protein
MALRLVQKGLANAAMFGADGKVVQAADILYKKTVLVERSRLVEQCKQLASAGGDPRIIFTQPRKHR